MKNNLNIQIFNNEENIMMKQLKKPNKEPKPLISIIIPTHNCLEYLPKAIESIFNQRVNNIEILIIDDNSNDGTWQWLQKQQEKHSQIRPYRLHGVGAARSRNFALKRVKADLIAFLDADDFWHNNKLIKQYRFHRDNPNVVLSFTNYHHTTPDNVDLGDCFQYWPHFKQLVKNDSNFHFLDQPTEKIYSENVIGTSCVMIKTKTYKLIGGFDHKLKSAEDWDLWLRFSKFGKVAYCNDELMEYLVRPNSETSDRLRRLDQMQVIMKRYRTYVRRHNIWSVFQADGRIEVGYAEHFAEQKQFMRAFWHQLKGLVLNPSIRNLKASIAFVWHSLQQKYKSKSAV
jgi:glycosyltransferase involved in cell wall biosynthesis